MQGVGFVVTELRDERRGVLSRRGGERGERIGRREKEGAETYGKEEGQRQTRGRWSGDRWE